MIALALAAALAASDFRPLDPENTLVIETSKGRVVVEMQPAMAPRAVARIKTLAREGVYDGLQFHRVIDGFVAQTGNPDNRDGGASGHPDLPPEFQFRVPAEAVSIAVERSDGIEGLMGATPFAGVRMADGRVRGCWAPTARAWSGWAGRPTPAPPTRRSSSCGLRPGGWITSTPSGAGWCRGRRRSLPSPPASRRRSPT
ncbi:peptidylprolyl isomerase [Phenylobacterium sp. J426]|nr:peptidylprolyl isomerase [Phenylobacterium sp. J426]MCR5874760.1 peptidylprolyl isomerase [Phenylobacterium sp. J426]